MTTRRTKAPTWYTFFKKTLVHTTCQEYLTGLQESMISKFAVMPTNCNSTHRLKKATIAAMLTQVVDSTSRNRRDALFSTKHSYQCRLFNVLYIEFKALMVPTRNCFCPESDTSSATTMSPSVTEAKAERNV